MSQKEFPQIPGYKIEKILGKGGMGIVYLAEQTALARKVALKVTLAALAELDASFTKRFVQEARATAALKHPNIITVFDAGVYENTSYMAMEYLPTGTLVDLEDKKLSHEEICKLFIGISRGLGAAHEAGFIHRDIKPDNILIDSNGCPMVTDFGIVKALDTKTALTRTGGTIGTPQYMSPEQIKAEDLDGRSDLYSLGIMMFNLLEGHVPFSDETPSAVYIKHVTTKPPLLSKKNSAFQPIISCLLRKDPIKRYKDADELVLALKATSNKDISNPLISQNMDKVSEPNDKTQMSAGLIKQITSEDTLVIMPDKKVPTAKILTAVITVLFAATGYFAYSKYFTTAEESAEWLSQQEDPNIVPAKIEKEIAQQVVEKDNTENITKTDTSESVSEIKVLLNEQQAKVIAAEQQTSRPVTTAESLVSKPTKFVKDVEVNNQELPPVQQQKINQLLAAAQKDLDNWKLLKPENDSAYAKFNAILSIEKENIQAQKGLLEIISKYDILSKQKVKEFKFSQALEMTKKAINLREEYLNKGYDKEQMFGFSNSIKLENLKKNRQETTALAKTYKLDLNHISKKASKTENQTAFIKGQEAYKQKNYKEAFKWLNQAAEKNNPAAEFMMGDLYYSGKGVSQSDSSALQWYERAANQNYVNAQLALATMYQQGSGVVQNQSKAIQWYEKAAAKNNPIAQYQLGLIAYKEGKNNAQKYTQALRWFQKAADQNDPWAQNKLGVMYKLGKGTPEDFVKAVEWFRKAAKQNIPEAQDNLGLVYFKGQGVQRDFEKSVEWYTRAANQNYSDSQGVLGAMYEYGRGVRKSNSTAVMWYKLAAKQGNAFAIKKLRKRGISKFD
jgi:TPR repeat protein/serine/threonine protein kinase